MPRKKRVPAQAEAAQAPHILRLPNETLQIIFSLVHLDDMYRRCNVLHSVILGLTRVCRRFRQVIHEARFWLRKEFQFADLLSKQYWTEEKPRCSGPWLRVILSDRYLQDCLRRKTDWTFDDAKVIMYVMDSLSSFIDRAQTLSFQLKQCHCLISDFHTGRTHFHDVTELSLSDVERRDYGPYGRGPTTKRPYDLERIGDCFPALKTLSISAAWGIVKGTLKTLAHLEDFRVDVRWLEPEKTFKPLEFPNVITRLSLNCVAPLSLIGFEHFGHLQHFKVEIIGFPEFRLLLSSLSKSRLESFEANISLWIENVELPNPVPLIASPLRHLHNLQLCFDNAPDRDCRFDRSQQPGFDIESVTWVLTWLSHLPSLKTFLIQSPADPIGATRLGRLTSLECLHWILRADDQYKNLLRDDDEDVQLDVDNFRANPAPWLSEVFQEETKPAIIVEHRDLRPPSKRTLW